LLLCGNERPLVERLGVEFFQQAPECPGVYLMRNSTDEVLYVGKAKNLRKRLGSYRVANPDRLGRRHLRLLRSVKRIELQECDSEASALAKEASLLRNLRPRFNRSGTWPSSPQYLTWRLSKNSFDLGVTRSLDPGWSFLGPLGLGAAPLRNALLRMIWCAIFPERGLTGMPAGWFQGRCGRIAAVPIPDKRRSGVGCLSQLLMDVRDGQVEELAAWLQKRVVEKCCPFEAVVRTADMELLKEMAVKRNQGTS